MSREVVVASGYFDPLHYGHIEYLQRARDLGHKLIVIVNNDRQAARKKGKAFMPARERVKLVRSLACVDAALESIDEDASVCKTLCIIHPDIFTNGGSQLSEDAPEAQVCAELGIKMVDGLGKAIVSEAWEVKQAQRMSRPSPKGVKKDDPGKAPVAKRRALRGLRGVSVDLDDTVWDCMAIINKAHAKRYEYVQQAFPDLAAKWPEEEAFKKEFYAAMERAGKADPAVAKNFTLKHKKALEEMGQSVGLTTENVEAIFAKFAEYRTPTSDDALFPHVVTTLEKICASGWVVGAVTNGNADPMKVPGLKASLKFCMNPDCGFAKPEAGMFNKMIQDNTPGATPESWVHVGDKLDEDVQGARAYGMASVWFRPKWKQGDEVPDEADAIITSWSQLHDVLQQWADAGEAKS